jgi:hypothetical protein
MRPARPGLYQIETADAPAKLPSNVALPMAVQGLGQQICDGEEMQFVAPALVVAVA